MAVIRRRSADRPDRQPMVARVDHGMIRLDGLSRRGPQMSATPDSTLADPQQIIADLQRKLNEAEAERDGALAQQTATAEVLGVINSSGGDLAPVFEAMLERAARLCSAGFGRAQIASLQLYPGGGRCVVFRGEALRLML